LKNSVYVVDGDYLIEKMFRKRGYFLTDTPDGAEILVFTGGHDVTPSYYGMGRHPTTSNSEARDSREKTFFLESEGKLRVGICRGSQFLCVMNGGTLYQDVDGHCNGPHNLIYTDDTGKDSVITVTSTHHQMMRPSYAADPNGGYNYRLWGFAAESSYRNFEPRDHQKPTQSEEGPDSEIVFFPETRSLCFQGHPEYDLKSCEDLFFSCLNRALSY